MGTREKHHWVKTDGDKPMATQHDGDKHRPQQEETRIAGVADGSTSKDQDPGDRLGVRPGWASISGQKKQQTRQAIRKHVGSKASAADMPPEQNKTHNRNGYSDTLLRQPPVPQTIHSNDRTQHRRRNNRRAHIKNIANTNGGGAKSQKRGDVYRANGGGMQLTTPQNRGGRQQSDAQQGCEHNPDGGGEPPILNTPSNKERHTNKRDERPKTGP